jgi:hypothetical protein
MDRLGFPELHDLSSHFMLREPLQKVPLNVGPAENKNMLQMFLPYILLTYGVEVIAEPYTSVPIRLLV